jgi:hypothetical protein
VLSPFDIRHEQRFFEFHQFPVQNMVSYLQLHASPLPDPQKAAVLSGQALGGRSHELALNEGTGFKIRAALLSRVDYKKLTILEEHRLFEENNVV